MKNGKRPTRRQKQAIIANKLNPDNWLVYKSEPDKLHIIHRHTNTRRSIFV